MPELAGRKIVITGGSGDLGQAMARTCVAQGAQVLLGYHRGRALAESLASELGAKCASLDVSDPTRISEFVSAADEALGGIDGWVNAAGIVKPGLLVSQTPLEVEQVVRVNLLGTLWCCQAAIPVLLKQRPRGNGQRGVILNLSSVTSQRAARGQSAYAASKGGVEALTRSLAVEYARKGIRVVALAPGAIESRMLEPTKALAGGELLERIPAKRIGSPLDVAEYASFLLSDRSQYVTGCVAHSDGGYVVA
ncbi:MAG: SDR family oxidoreductase [Polyangiaceae bacterium]|nr:SDR family oxidoreductase [Polyangiaceae bacterium]